MRTELVYGTSVSDPASPTCPSIAKGSFACAKCVGLVRASQRPLAQPRWGSNLNFLWVAFGTWRRMELIRRAGAHVRRNSQASVEVVCSATAGQLTNVAEELGDRAGYREVLCSHTAPLTFKLTFSDLLLFSRMLVALVALECSCDMNRPALCCDSVVWVVS